MNRRFRFRRFRFCLFMYSANPEAVTAGGSPLGRSNPAPIHNHPDRPSLLHHRGVNSHRETWIIPTALMTLTPTKNVLSPRPPQPYPGSRGVPCGDLLRLFASLDAYDAAAWKRL